MEKTLTLTSTVPVPKDFAEFANLSEINHRAITFTMMNTIDELKKDLKALQQAPAPQGIAPETTLPDVSAKVTKAKKDHGVPSTKEENTSFEENVPLAVVAVLEKRADEDKQVGGSTLGKKIGKTSKYHFINAQMRNDKFYNYMASTSIDGKTVSMGASKHEIECALLADAHLDGIGDEKRPRNRDDFPEIMEAYQKSQKKEKNA